MRKWVLAAIAVFVLFVGAYLASPYLAVHHFRSVAKSGDASQLEQAVDFPRVRESLKGQFNAAMAARAGSDPALKDNPFAGLAMMMGPAIVDRMVDALVTPDGVWVSVIRDGTVVRIDPATGDVDTTVQLKPKGSEPEGLAWDGTHLWVVDQAGGRVVELDPDGAVVDEFRTGDEPRLVTAGDSGIWVANYGGTSVSRIADGKVRTFRLTACAGPQGIAEVAGFIALALGSREWLVMADVFAGQYPVVTAIAAFLLLGERLDTRQKRAIALVAAGVAVVALGAR